MAAFMIYSTIPSHLCVERGYPNPDTDPNGWIDAVRHRVARQVQDYGFDLEVANKIIRTAITRADYEPPAPLSDIEMEILEDLAA